MPMEADSRVACPIVRTHQRFLLRTLEFTQQYASMYRCRLEAQYGPALRAIQQIVREEVAGGACTSPASLEPRRVLELQPNTPAVCVGVAYKNMKLLPRFLDEYHRELVRIDAGDEDNDDGEVAADSAPLDEAAAAKRKEMEEEEERDDAVGAPASVDEHYSVCNSADELLIEDSSGRVLLQGLDRDRFCTGVVLGIYGVLRPNGNVEVIRYALAGDVRGTYVPRPLTRVSRETANSPCYIAFVSGLNVNVPRDASPEAHAAATRSRAALELLMDFLCGNTSNTGLRDKARHVTRLVIGGNSIAPTDELKLKMKVKLDPSDHVRMNDDKARAGIITSATLMRELDVVLERLVSSVEVELMPGDNDMSDAFQPQQPLHPVLLRKSARHSTLRLVTNPFTFTAIPVSSEEKESDIAEAKRPRVEVSEGVNVFVTSGQNINDVARESRFPTRLETMAMVVESGCACPTAPNTLFSYPFCKSDPFLFQRTPHCVVACDQPCFETRYATLEEMYMETHQSYTGRDGAATKTENEEKVGGGSTAGIRLVCVPSFARTGALVLMDVNSPTLETTAILFTVP